MSRRKPYQRPLRWWRVDPKKRPKGWWKRQRARTKANRWPAPVPQCPFCGLTYKAFRGPLSWGEAKAQLWEESEAAVAEGDLSKEVNRRTVLGRMMEGKRKAWNEHLWTEFDLWEGGELELDPGLPPARVDELMPEVAELVQLAELGEVPLPYDDYGEPDWYGEELPTEAYTWTPEQWERSTPIGEELEREWFAELGEREQVPPPIPEFLRNPPPWLWRKLGWGALAWLVAGYVWDDWVYPELVGSIARQRAHARGLPMLSVGVGTPGSSFRCNLLGPGPLGDVNVDLQGIPGTGVVPADVQALPFADGSFGAAVAAHVLEHVPDPIKALSELERVTAGPVYVITPPWYNAYTYLHPEHRWLRRRSDGAWLPLYQQQKG